VDAGREAGPLAAGIRVPEKECRRHLAVFRPCRLAVLHPCPQGQRPAVREEKQRPGDVFSGRQTPAQAAVRSVPQAQDALAVEGGQRPAIGVEREPLEFPVVARKAAQLLAGGDLEEEKLAAIVAVRGQELAVGGEGERTGGGGVGPEGAQAPAGGQVPEVDGGILPRGGQEVRGRTAGRADVMVDALTEAQAAEAGPRAGRQQVVVVVGGRERGRSGEEEASAQERRQAREHGSPSVE
jgi:hypothetical protein